MRQPISNEHPIKLKIEFYRRRREGQLLFVSTEEALFPQSYPQAQFWYQLSGSPLTQESTKSITGISNRL